MLFEGMLSSFDKERCHGVNALHCNSGPPNKAKGSYNVLTHLVLTPQI